MKSKRRVAIGQPIYRAWEEVSIWGTKRKDVVCDSCRS